MGVEIQSSPELSSIATGSRLLGSIERFFESVVAAWETSAAKGGLLAALTSSQSRDGHLVRMAGWTTLGAAGSHVLLVGIDDLVRPAMAGLGWFAAFPLAIACIWKPQAVVVAWNSSRIWKGKKRPCP